MNVVRSFPIPNIHKLPKVEDILSRGGGAVVIPTKVGYIIAATDGKGLERKFNLKERRPNKPGVVVTSDLGQFYELAQVRDDNGKDSGYTASDRNVVDYLYRSGALVGFILPWNKDALRKYVPEDVHPFMRSQKDGSSCFVFNHGIYTEQLAGNMFAKHGKLVFASSANPSGKGNRGTFQCIGERILQGIDMGIEADEYVAAQQPGKSPDERFEQGVMISLVKEHPTFVRPGLNGPEIAAMITEVLGRDRSWDYRPGQYD